MINQAENREVQQQKRREEQQYNSFLYKFQQQIIDAWKPVPYTSNNVILYSVLTVVCVTIGLVLILTAPTTPQIQFNYDDNIDGDGNIISKNFQLTQTLPQPIYLYYGLTNYYQNHRRYLKFFSPDQMNGINIDTKTAISSCGGDAYTNQQIGAASSVNSTLLDPAAIAFPCGQRAKSYLKIKPQLDSIKLFKGVNPITLNRQGVSWPDDAKSYKDSDNLYKQAITNADQAWLVWFRPAAKNYFYKLHSRIQSDLQPGNYTFKATDFFDNTYGQKKFYLSKSNYMGNKDYFLGIAFLALGGGCLIVLVVFIAKCVTQMRDRPKQN